MTDIFEQLEAMRPLIIGGSWAELEERYRERSGAVGASTAEAIQSVDLRDYGAQLARSASEAVKRAGRTGARTVYWEFDPDNDWEGSFFLCQTYRPEIAGDDDWASDFYDWLSTGGLPPFARLYDPGFGTTPSATAANAFLFARTFAAFGRAVRPEWPASLPLCAGFHDQTSVFRVIESP